MGQQSHCYGRYIVLGHSEPSELPWVTGAPPRLHPGTSALGTISPSPHMKK